MIGLDKIAKAITGAGTTFAALFEVVTGGDSAGHEGITSGEWVRLVVFTVLAFVAVWLIPNGGKSDPPA